MFRLFKKSNSEIEYWEAWHDPNSKTITFHFGIVGTRGKTATLAFEGKDAAVKIEEFAKQPLSVGFESMGLSQSLFIQKTLDSWGSDDDLALRHRIEDLMNDTLGWIGAGYCDGGEIGSGRFTVFCCVIDATISAKAAVETLRRESILDGIVIASKRTSNGDYNIHWPTDFTGIFSLL